MQNDLDEIEDDDEVDQDEEKAAGVEQAEREQQNITKKWHSSIWFSFCSKATLSF